MANRGIGQLFARKSVEQMHAEHAGSELKRSLGALNLVLLGIAGIGLVVLLLQRPNLVKLKMDLDLNPTDLARLEDDADMVVQLPRLRRF